jgi:hypothetical protein
MFLKVQIAAPQSVNLIEKVWLKVLDIVSDQVHGKVWDQVRDQVWDKTWNQILLSIEGED